VIRKQRLKGRKPLQETGRRAGPFLPEASHALGLAGIEAKTTDQQRHRIVAALSFQGVCGGG
jgi:hypothetical protein